MSEHPSFGEGPEEPVRNPYQDLEIPLREPPEPHDPHEPGINNHEALQHLPQAPHADEVPVSSDEAANVHNQTNAQLASTREALAHLQEVVDSKPEYDALTGVLSRDGLDKRLMAEFGVMDSNKAYQSPDLRRSPLTRYAAVYTLDLAELKTFNSEFSEDAGDKMIQRLGRMLDTITRENDIVARFGGDDFRLVVLLPERFPEAAPGESVLSDEDRRQTYAQEVYEKLVAEVSQPRDVQPDGSPRDPAEYLREQAAAYHNGEPLNVRPVASVGYAMGEIRPLTTDEQDEAVNARDGATSTYHVLARLSSEREKAHKAQLEAKGIALPRPRKLIDEPEHQAE